MAVNPAPNDGSPADMVYSAYLCVAQDIRTERLEGIRQVKKGARYGGVLGLEDLKERQDLVLLSDDEIRSDRAWMKAHKLRTLPCKKPPLDFLSACAYNFRAANTKDGDCGLPRLSGLYTITVDSFWKFRDRDAEDVQAEADAKAQAIANAAGQPEVEANERATRAQLPTPFHSAWENGNTPAGGVRWTPPPPQSTKPAIPAPETLQAP